MTIQRGLFALLLAGFASLSARADVKGWAQARRLVLLERARLGPFASTLETDAVSATYPQRVDHFAANDLRTFAQRYWVDSSSVRAGTAAHAPVIYSICGESTCSPSQGSAVMSRVRRLGAHLVVLEHRYYGRSQPFSDLSTENLRYLSTPQAIEDLASLQRFLMETQNFKGPWIAVGGSYAGSLAAFYQLKHPELVAGAWSSSGPVRAKANFEEYDRHVALVAGPACLARIQAAVKEVEALLANPTSALEVKRLFGATEITHDVDFLYVMADMVAAAVQYGFQRTFCGALEKTTAQNLVSVYADIGTRVLAQLGVSALEISFQSAVSLDPQDYISGFGMRGWMWQSCTEYGYYQTAFRDPKESSRSTRIDEPYHDQVCERLFGLKQPVDAAATNREFFEWLLRTSTSRVIYTNGGNDPWQHLSLRPDDLADAPIPRDDVAAVLIGGASHCSDLSGGNSAEFQRAYGVLDGLLARWLK